MHDVVKELEDRAAIQHAPTLDGVTLASFHAAKGLEWDAVFLVGLSEGLVPISYAKDQAGYDEERRLLYVGITRARIHLFLSWSLARTPGGRAHRYPSRFLDGIKSVRQASKEATKHLQKTRTKGHARGVHQLRYLLDQRQRTKAQTLCFLPCGL